MADPATFLASRFFTENSLFQLWKKNILCLSLYDYLINIVNITSFPKITKCPFKQDILFSLQSLSNKICNKNKVPLPEAQLKLFRNHPATRKQHN